ncbi:MAG: arylesterase [Pseudomonadaceae bacterium]|jgi:acyl-CoA thioesterase-1|nr:arylesterase [Pseudomonadaceae bacterium]
MRVWWMGLLVALWLPLQGASAATLLVLGDSISAGFGLDTRLGWVNLLQQRLTAQGLDYKVVNASISGDTSAGGLARLGPLLSEHKPKLVVVELGGNDGLRGLPPAQMQQNLASIIGQSQAGGARVLLLGMQLPANYGARYNQLFTQVYVQLAASEKVALVPFFLEGVGGVPLLMQGDGIHPAAAGQPRMLDNLWPQLQPLL